MVTDKPKAHSRVTSFARKLEDEFTLTKWKMRNVLIGAAQRPDIIAATLASVSYKGALDKLAEAAMDAAKANVGRELGTALHTLTEQADSGITVDMPSPIREDIAAYTQCLADLGVTVTRMEEVVVIPDLKLAGRFDRLINVMGTTYVMDLKTGADLSYSWNSIAIQLALYAQAATIYNPVTCTHEPMPAVDQRRGLVVHLPAGQATATPYWVNLAEGRRGIDLTKSVLGWRSTKGVAEAAVNLRGELREYVVAHVASILVAGFGAELAGCWPMDVPTLKAFDGHTEAQFDAILDACWRVEGDHSMPFIDMADPRHRDQVIKATKRKGTK
jgi:hypothetical protein